MKREGLLDMRKAKTEGGRRLQKGNTGVNMIKVHYMHMEMSP
jgi:hypothetical protein